MIETVTILFQYIMNVIELKNDVSVSQSEEVKKGRD